MKEKVIEWLDALSTCMNNIMANSELNLGEFNEETGEYEYEFRHYGFNFNYYECSYFQLKDVRPVAELAGLDVQKRDREDDEYPTEYYFKYNGCVFISLSEDPWTE